MHKFNNSYTFTLPRSIAISFSLTAPCLLFSTFYANFTVMRRVPLGLGVCVCVLMLLCGVGVYVCDVSE